MFHVRPDYGFTLLMHVTRKNKKFGDILLKYCKNNMKPSSFLNFINAQNKEAISIDSSSYEW